jgi:hypothetical protein
MSGVSKIFLFVCIKTLVISFSVFVFYWCGWYGALMFHEPYISRINGMDFYNFIYLFIPWLVVIFLFLINYFQDFHIKNQKISVSIHILIYIGFILCTLNDFVYHPYEHLLLTVSLGTPLITRPSLDFLLNKYYFSRNAQ